MTLTGVGSKKVIWEKNATYSWCEQLELHWRKYRNDGAALEQKCSDCAGMMVPHGGNAVIVLECRTKRECILSVAFAY